MKNLNKFGIVLLLFTFGIKSFAQTFGIKGGSNFSNMTVEDFEGTYSDNYKMTRGFHVGPILDVPMNQVVSLETGLLLSTKGFKVREEDSFIGETYINTAKLNLIYLDVPITLKGTFNLDKFKIYGLIGPYVGAGISGKSKYEEISNGETESRDEDIKFGSDIDEDHFKRLDYGLSSGVGIETNSMLIEASYDFGLANISAYSGEGNKINNKVLMISVGILFGYKSKA